MFVHLWPGPGAQVWHARPLVIVLIDELYALTNTMAACAVVRLVQVSGEPAYV